MIKLIAASLALALGYAFAHRKRTPVDPVGDWERTHDSTETAYPESQQSAP